MADTTLSLKEAIAQYPKSVVKMPYRGVKFFYSTALVLGNGSFGIVYKAWSNEGKIELAAKIIEKSCLMDHYKVKENLDREIKIMKLMKGCENVVQISAALEVKGKIIIIMELCEYDLEKFLVLRKQFFTEEEVVHFLHQLAEGMKELRKHNIVHRDIKPQNILIKKDKVMKDKLTFKLADFGYARHFDYSKNKCMTSVVGTPVYMAPEALRCYFFPGPKVNYNDKVDIWSIGALLYKVIVGKCGFYVRNVSLIYDLLKEKRDAIAFEFIVSQKPTYIDELPSSVNERLSGPFRQSMNFLLKSMLKFDDKQRMSFPKFFASIEDMMQSKIELINLLHGSSFKIISEPRLKADVVVKKVTSRWGDPVDQLVIFSMAYSKYIAKHQQLSDEDFESLLVKAGGQHGHAKLYVLPVQQLRQDDVAPDISCLDLLKSALDQHQTQNLVKNQRFTDEIMYIIDCLRMQLMNQVHAGEKLSRFAISETGLSNDYNQLKKDVHQALAKVSMTVETLNKELALFRSIACETQLPQLLTQLVEKEGELRQLDMEYQTKALPPYEPLFYWPDCEVKIKLLIDLTTTLHMGNIPKNCMTLYKYCVDMITDMTNRNRLHLVDYCDVLLSTWSLYTKSTCIEEVSKLLEAVELAREQMLADVIKPMELTHSDVDSYSSNFKSLEDYTILLENLRQENKELQEKLASERLNCVASKKKYNEALTSLRQSELSIMDREMEEQRSKTCAVLGDLNQQLRQFCVIGEKMAISKAAEDGGATTSDVEGVQSPRNKGEKLLGTEQLQLLAKAQEVARVVYGNISLIDGGGTQVGAADQENFVKIGYPSDYKAGDVVIMTPVNTQRGAVPSVLHLQWMKPHILMDYTCLGPLGIRIGKVPQLFFAKLCEAPRQTKFENSPKMAQDIGQSSGIFYRVRVDPVSMKFNDRYLTLLSGDEQQKSLLPLRSPPGNK